MKRLALMFQWGVSIAVCIYNSTLKKSQNQRAAGFCSIQTDLVTLVACHAFLQPLRWWCEAKASQLPM